MSEKSKNNNSFVAYWVPVIIITGLLYLIALSALTIISTIRFENFNKEQIPFIVELRDSASESDIFKLEQQISKSNYCVPSTVQFISKEEAVNKLVSADLKKEEIEVFDENLLPNIIEFQLKKDFASKESEIITNLKKQPMVADVFSNQVISDDLKSNLQRLRLLVIFLLIFFIFVAISIVYKTNKFTLQNAAYNQKSNYEKTVLLKEQFKTDLKSGLISGLTAFVFLSLTLILFQNQVIDITFNEKILTLSIFALFILAVAFLLFWGCTKFIANQINKSK